MSDFGQIIAPYRVAPAQGGLDDLALFLQRREMTDQSQQQSALAAATRAYLAQQNGLPGGVDPTAVQGYQIAGDTNTRAWNADNRAGAQEGRAAQDHQSRYDFANKFMEALPEQSDPYTRALQLAGGVYGAEGLNSALGGQYARQGELTNRSQMNDADNIAAQQRLETELRMRAKAAAAEQNRLTGVETDQQERIRQALVKGAQTGDYTDFYSMVPNAMVAPVQYDRETQDKESAAQRAAQAKIDEDKEILRRQLADKEKKTGMTAEQQKGVAETRFNRMARGRSPEQVAGSVVENSQRMIAPYSAREVDVMRTLYPDVYDKAYQDNLKQQQEQRYQQQVQKAQNPLWYYIQKVLNKLPDA